jgi:hypothetical protein
MAKDIEMRREQRESPVGAAREKIEAAAASVESRLPAGWEDYIREYPLAFVGGGIVAGFLLASLPIVPRRFLRTALATFAGRFAGAQLAMFAQNAIAQH